MREAGVDRILLYRTKDFDSFCRGYSESRKQILLRAEATCFLDPILKSPNQYLA